MYKRLALAAALVLALALGTAVPAQEMRKYIEADTATVSAIDRDAGRLTLEGEDGPRTFVVEPATRVLRGTLPAELKEVRVGDRVIVEARDEVGDDSAQLVADRIVIVVDDPAAE